MGLWSNVFQILILVPSLSLADILSISHLINVNGFLKLKIYAGQFRVSWCISPQRDCALACNAITDSCGSGTDWRDLLRYHVRTGQTPDHSPPPFNLSALWLTRMPHLILITGNSLIHYSLLSTEEDWTFNTVCGLILWILTSQE